MRGWYRNLDYVLPLVWAALVVVGLVAIWSTTHGIAAEYLPESVQQNFWRQLQWAGVCAVGILIALSLPVRFFQQIAYPTYAFTLLLCLAAAFFGREVNGAKAWIFGVQTAELMKVGAVMAVAKLLSTRKPNARNLRYAAGAVAFLSVPAFIIIFLQNDTGSALVLLGLVPIMLFWSGIPLSTVALMISPAIAGYFAIVYPPVAYAFAIIFTLAMWFYTKERLLAGLSALFTGGTIAAITFALTIIFQPYQVARIVSFTNPGAEEFRSGVGYQAFQSLAAIGSGGLYGKGFMRGTQTSGGFVPEQSTDYVFSVIGEEFGFIGSIIVLVLFALLLIRLVNLGTRVKHPFGSMVAAGAAGIYLLHLFINVGMVSGLLPSIGIPLPFVSYGGSALLANTALVAIVLALHMRRDDFSIYGY